MTTTTMHRFSKVAWAFVLMLVLSCCAAIGYVPENGCARLIVENHAWSDVAIYTADGRRLGGSLGTGDRREHALCNRTAAVLRVRAIGGDFDFLISATDQTWIPDRTYTLLVENAVRLSTLLPIER